ETMSNKVHVLDEITVSKIAAGEVVERPASVVKELVENAIDAEATKVVIDIKSDGKNVASISVLDNGCGLSFDDAVVAFRQHATSKISGPGDLDRIGTLGFRGEALASIAAVSKVTFTSKEKDSDTPEAVQIVVHGGSLVRHNAVGAPEGTSVVVEDLFYNTPARKKFQKSLATELAHIYDMVERISLAHRAISFVLLYNGKERFRTYGNGSYPDAIAAVFGTAFAKDLVEVSATGKLASVSGWITKPGCEMRPTPSRFYLTINSRQITSRTLQWAIREGYGTLIPKGMYPAAFLDITLDLRDVDVNVHPTKREVRISRERDVAMIVQDAVYTALHTGPVFPAAKPEPADTQTKLADEEKPVIRERDDHVPSVPERKAGQSLSAAIASTLSALPEFSTPRRTEQQLKRTERIVAAEKDTASPAEIPEVLGQIGGTYIVAQDASGDLLIIDQHAAHERILYDALLKKSAKHQAGQELLVPVPISFTRAEQTALPVLLPALEQAGYVIEPFGADGWAVRSVPVISSTLGDPAVIHELIAEVSGESEKNPERVLDRVLKTAACRAVVKGHTALTISQMQDLLRQLAGTDSPYTCPHGRPTVITLSREKLEKMFLRT
ncbi:MAG TPA: DNA mismatch repair endonuclease MutL, partial [Methanocorpusculum sp.]|nr:DNA mismatch repair endonuclease MutL [Methanocorpusculum sp.]